MSEKKTYTEKRYNSENKKYEKVTLKVVATEELVGKNLIQDLIEEAMVEENGVIDETLRDTILYKLEKADFAWSFNDK